MASYATVVLCLTSLLLDDGVRHHFHYDRAREVLTDGLELEPWTQAGSAAQERRRAVYRRLLWRLSEAALS